MQYTSPLHFLADKNPADITPANLKKWRKEYLLKFDLLQQPTVTVAGKEFDKNQLQAAFDLMKTDADFHIKLYKNKQLLAFLENGDTTFFRVNGKIEELADPEFKAKIKPYFVHRFSETLHKCTTNRGFQSIRTLKEIRESYFKMPADFADEAYSKTFAFLENHVNEGIKNLSDPYKEGVKRGLKKEAVQFFDLHTLNVFLNLPDYFSSIANKYAILAHNYLVQVLRNNRNPEQTSRPVARVLLNVCKIDAAIRNDPQSKELVRVFERIMDKKEVPTKQMVRNGKWTGWRTFVLFGVLLLFFAMFGSLPERCARLSDRDKAIKKYNYYRNKRYKPPVKEGKIAAEELIGAWRSDLFIQKARIFRTFHFYNTDVGKLVYQFVTVHGEEQARITAWYQWKIDDSKRSSRLNLMKTRLRGELIIEGDVESLPERERKVFDEVVNSLQSKASEEGISFKSGNEHFTLAGRKYEYEDGYNPEDLPTDIQVEVKKVKQHELDLIFAGNELAASFVKDTTTGRMHEFTVSTMDHLFLLNRTNKLGYIELDESGVYLRPMNWTKGKGYMPEGVFKDINYIRNGERRKGDIEMLYGRSFRFREMEEGIENEALKIKN